MIDQNKLQKGWESYRVNVIHPDAGPNQITESRNAFYGGASYLFKLLHDVGAAGIEEAEMEKHFDAILAELTAFSVELAKRTCAGNA